MISLLIWIWDWFKKDDVITYLFQRSRLKFLFLLVFDVVISGAVFFAGYQFFGPNNWARHEQFAITHPGFMPSQIDTVLDFIEREPGHIYWLGPKDNYQYSFHGYRDFVAGINYLPAPSSETLDTRPSISIETYKNAKAYSLVAHHWTLASTGSFTTTNGTSVKFDKNNYTFEEILPARKSEVITINFSAPQPVTTLLNSVSEIEALK